MNINTQMQESQVGKKKKKKDNAAGLFQEYQYGNIMYG